MSEITFSATQLEQWINVFVSLNNITIQGLILVH